jgi:hypothetical protein
LFPYLPKGFVSKVLKGALNQAFGLALAASAVTLLLGYGVRGALVRALAADSGSADYGRVYLA